jgi:hypothetical protein
MNEGSGMSSSDSYSSSSSSMVYIQGQPLHEQEQAGAPMNESWPNEDQQERKPARASSDNKQGDSKQGQVEVVTTSGDRQATTRGGMRGMAMTAAASGAAGKSSPSLSSSSSPSDTSRNAAPCQLMCVGCFREVAMRLEEDKPMGTVCTHT